MSFDTVARWYRTLETIAFGNVLQHARIACLNEIGSPRRALIVGEGNGRFVSELVRSRDTIEIDCLDASKRMLELARNRVEKESPDSIPRIRFVQRDIRSWTPPLARYDLIVSHFFLDCFPRGQLFEVVSKLAQGATPDATWLLADFCLPRKGLARLSAHVWLAAMYGFFRCAAGIEAAHLVDPSHFLQAGGFVLERQHLFRSGMVKSELWRREL